MGFMVLTPVDELQAVNILLAAIGEAAVSSLTEATTVEVTQAKTLLSNTNRSIQQKGWHFNTEWDVVYTRDSDNNIPIGTNILSAYQFNTLMTIRGKGDGTGNLFFYDLKDNTFVWTGSLNKVIQISLIDFIDTPQTFRQYVTIRAARIFQEETIGQNSAEIINSKEEAEAYADLLDDDANVAGLNVGWNDNNMFRITKLNRNFR
jgi:hypothetical protein|tara:strand:+ start:4384 stop:4998 length:615 start_codon:yes stop_codon:yes gene_type:complete